MAFDPFKKFRKNKPDEAVSPLSEEHVAEELKKRPTPPRSSGGKFVSTKKPEKKPNVNAVKKSQTISTTEEPIIVSFYGVDIRKIYKDNKWYFATQDILSLAKPASAGGEVIINPEYEKALKELSLNIKGVTYANAENSMKLVQKMEASFPGPLSRWLNELSQMPFVPNKEIPTSLPPA